MRIRSSVRRAEPAFDRPDDRPSPIGAFARDDGTDPMPHADPGADDPAGRMPDGQHVGERMRELRAALVGRRTGPPGQPMTLVVADPDARAGASMLAANLAVASARLGYQVLLVDANIARPEQHELFGMTNDHGVTNMAEWQADADRGIQATAVRGLSLLAAGPGVDNPAEMIERLGLCDRLRRYGRRFDTVLIDATAQPAPTAAAAAQGSDGVLLAVRRGSTPIDAIRRTIASFADRQVESLGLVAIA